jgi:hypothetical protein
VFILNFAGCGAVQSIAVTQKASNLYTNVVHCSLLLPRVFDELRYCANIPAFGTSGVRVL